MTCGGSCCNSSYQTTSGRSRRLEVNGYGLQVVTLSEGVTDRGVEGIGGVTVGNHDVLQRIAVVEHVVTKVSVGQSRCLEGDGLQLCAVGKYAVCFQVGNGCGDDCVYDAGACEHVSGQDRIHGCSSGDRTIGALGDVGGTKLEGLLIRDDVLSGQDDFGDGYTVLEEVSTDGVGCGGRCEAEVAQLCAVRERVLAQIRSGSGDGHVVELDTAVECVSADGGDALCDGYGLKVEAVSERRSFDRTDLSGDGDALEQAAGECTGSDCGERAGKYDVFGRVGVRVVVQGGLVCAVDGAVGLDREVRVLRVDGNDGHISTACEGVTVEEEYRCGDVAGGQLIARTEGKLAQVLKTNGQSGGLEVVAIEECVVTKVDDVCGDCNSFEVVAVCKCVVADSGKLSHCGEGNLGDAAVLKDVAADELQRVGKNDVDQVGRVLEDVILCLGGGTQVDHRVTGSEDCALKSGTILECGGADDGYGCGDVDGLEALVVVECLSADLGEVVAEDDGLKARTALKGLCGDLGNAGQVDFLEAGTTLEGTQIVGAFKQLAQAIGEVDGYQRRAAFEGLAAQSIELAVADEGDLLQGRYLAKGHSADGLYGRGNLDFLQCRIGEGVITDRGDVLLEGDLFQRNTVLECLLLNCAQSCGQGHRLELDTAVEGVCAQSLNGVGQLDVFQHVGVRGAVLPVECVITDGGQLATGRKRYRLEGCHAGEGVFAKSCNTLGDVDGGQRGLLEGVTLDRRQACGKSQGRTREFLEGIACDLSNGIGNLEARSGLRGGEAVEDVGLACICGLIVKNAVDGLQHGVSGVNGDGLQLGHTLIIHTGGGQRTEEGYGLAAVI